MALKELLEYQTVDADLRKIEQEIASSPERKKVLQAKKFLESAGERLEYLDNRAVELRRNVQGLTRRYMDISKAISELSGVEEMVSGGGDATFYKRNAQQLADELHVLRTEINKTTDEIKAITDEYNKLKEETIAKQKQYKEFNEKYKEVKNAKSKDVDAINAKLAQIAKKIPTEMLDRYKQKRKEKVFPILVPLNVDRCICGMDFAIAQQSALDGGNLVECDHCRRLVYKNA